MNEDWILIGEKDPERRYRRVSIAPHLIATLLGTGTQQAIPSEHVPDLRIVGVRFSSWRGAIEAIVQSASFEPVSEAEYEPVWNPQYTVVSEAVPA